jgi:hypothetical protein
VERGARGAKIIGFGLATLGSNANALDRSGDRNERALRAWQAEAVTEPSGIGSTKRKFVPAWRRCSNSAARIYRAGPLVEAASL